MQGKLPFLQWILIHVTRKINGAEYFYVLLTFKRNKINKFYYLLPISSNAMFEFVSDADEIGSQFDSGYHNFKTYLFLKSLYSCNIYRTKNAKFMCPLVAVFSKINQSLFLRCSRCRLIRSALISIRIV